MIKNSYIKIFRFVLKRTPTTSEKGPTRAFSVPCFPIFDMSIEIYPQLVISKYQSQTYSDSIHSPKTNYGSHKNGKGQTLMRIIKISELFETVFDRLQVVLIRYPENRRLWYIKRTPLLLLI